MLFIGIAGVCNWSWNFPQEENFIEKSFQHVNETLSAAFWSSISSHYIKTAAKFQSSHKQMCTPAWHSDHLHWLPVSSTDTEATDIFWSLLCTWLMCVICIWVMKKNKDRRFPSTWLSEPAPITSLLHLFWYGCLYSTRLNNLPECCNASFWWDHSSAAM